MLFNFGENCDFVAESCIVDSGSWKIIPGDEERYIFDLRENCFRSRKIMVFLILFVTKNNMCIFSLVIVSDNEELRLLHFYQNCFSGRK